MQLLAIRIPLLRLHDRIEDTGIRHPIHSTISYSRPARNVVSQADIDRPIPNQRTPYRQR